MKDLTEADVVFCQMKTEFAENLRPCPFCGSKAVLYGSLTTAADQHLYRAECSVCLSASAVYRSIENVERAWNKRVGEK